MFTRVKNNTAEAPPQTNNNQHQLRDTNIDKTQHRDITSNCKADATVESGLDWFHSIAPSLSPDGMASPMITSTQENLNGKGNSSWSEMSTVTSELHCQTEKDVLSNTGSILNHDVVSNPFQTITSASEGENRKAEKNENIKEKSSITQEEIKQSVRQKDDKHPKSVGSVFQKMSKNLRVRRLRELQLYQQQCDKEGGGRGHGEMLVSRDSASTHVTDLDRTSECASSTLSGKNCPSNNLVQDNLSSGKESRFEKEEDQTGTKNICAVLREETTPEAETGKDLYAKLSDFMFQPKKMRPLVHNHPLNASGVSAEFHTECNPRDVHTFTGSRISRQPLSNDYSVGSLTDTEKNIIKKRENQNQGGSMRKQVSCASEVGDSRSEASIGFTSEKLDKDVFSLGKDKLAWRKTVGRLKGTDDTESLRQQQRTRVNTGDGTKVNGFTCTPPLKPSTNISDSAPSESGHTVSTVALSTLAKLSRFSFTCTTEPTTKAQTKVGENPPAEVEQSSLKKDSAECLRANSNDKNTLNPPEHSPLGKKIKTVVIMGKVKDILAPPEVTSGQKHERGIKSPTKTMSECKSKQIEPTPAANHSNSVKLVTDGPVDYQSPISMKKRKCFELGPPLSSVGGSKGPFSGLSLFGSVELSNDVLDTDWEQEVSKKAKL